MSEGLLIFFAGLVGLIGSILKLAIDIRNKRTTPDAKYETDIKQFDKALATGNADDISVAFEQLHREANKRDSDTGRQDGEKAGKR